MAEDNEYDVIVVGSGGGALLSAVRAHDLGMKVLVIEKSDQYGGTSATSGGALWIPLNGAVEDSYESAFTYMKTAAAGTTTDSKIRAYLDSAKEMIRFVNDKTALRYQVSTGYADYYPDVPCALDMGRAMEPVPFDGALLGEEIHKLRPSHPGVTLMGIGMTIPESNVMATKAPGWLWIVLKILFRYYLDLPWRFKTKRDRRLCLGNALIGGLRHAMLARDIPLWLNCPLESLIREDGRVVGVIARREGRPITLRAQRGVILAAGGFERNQEMRDKYLPQPSRQEWACTPKGLNTGDTIRAAEAIGARLDNMHMIWGTPTVRAPEAPQQGQQAIFAERGFGGSVIVNQQGRRFVNETISYDRFVDAMYADHARNGGCIPAWMVFDAKYRKNCPIGPLLPASAMPDSKVPPEWFGDFVFKDNTLEGLARQIGVDPEGLMDSVRKNNAYAKTGVDLDFHRGESAYDRYWSICGIKPNPCLVAIDQGPYYAVRLDAGDTGTRGGPAVTEDAQVLDQGGTPISGLYCIGNNAAAPLGRVYGGAGGTIGPGMVFGYRAVNHLAQV
ncbi:FAD-binding protein [Denitratisoma oestradiolicum]|uniref:3-oxosteroid 1-dehydrogenase n=1 Tax=Denitratisoma oestradiolicum TaxID=311182 RepID=A0A6S6Y1R7_9PROT|nr:FAD-binding protein [Denitratisoma oestradiolicum]TWO79180.1 hypothetical protein CBW56_15965 [Denitratisoma oestradiolicum]CAB1370821.1 3-oxosteroid 1-dehydrogenase [Denitratisoma oestradiolicum]